jgi:hypothetical protein
MVSISDINQSSGRTVSGMILSKQLFQVRDFYVCSDILQMHLLILSLSSLLCLSVVMKPDGTVGWHGRMSEMGNHWKAFLDPPPTHIHILMDFLHCQAYNIENSEASLFVSLRSQGIPPICISSCGLVSLVGDA